MSAFSKRKYAFYRKTTAKAFAKHDFINQEQKV